MENSIFILRIYRQRPFQESGQRDFCQCNSNGESGNGNNDCLGASGPMSTTTATPTCLLPTQPDRRFCSRITAAVFAPVTGGLGAFAADSAPRDGGIFLDFNNDGLVDLFVVHNGQQTNSSKQSASSFCGHSSSAHVNFNGPGRSAVAADVNNDGYQDIYIVNANAPNNFM